MPGCTRPAQAQRHARWLLAAQQGAGQIVSWRAGLDHLADHPVRPGDVILIDDPDQPAGPAGQAERLFTAGFDALLSAVTLQRRERAYVLRTKPGFTTSMGRFMGRPASDPDAPPQIVTASFRFDAGASDPARHLYVVVCKASRDQIWPLDGTAVYFGARKTLAASRAWQVAEVRQTAADECEVTAFSALPDRTTGIDLPSLAASSVRPVRPDISRPPAGVTGLAARQFEARRGQQITRN